MTWPCKLTDGLCSQITLCCWLIISALFAATVVAEQLDKTNGRLLDESEYRTELEEVVVVGKKPQWRASEPEPWRPERFKLPEIEKSPRMQWFPEYEKDERDLYQNVRDRTGEKAEIKLFEWKF